MGGLGAPGLGLDGAGLSAGDSWSSCSALGSCSSLDPGLELGLLGDAWSNCLSSSAPNPDNGVTLTPKLCKLSVSVGDGEGAGARGDPLGCFVTGKVNAVGFIEVPSYSVNEVQTLLYHNSGRSFCKKHQAVGRRLELPEELVEFRGVRVVS